MKSKIPDTLDELNVKYFKLMNGDSIVSYVHDNISDTGAVIGLEEPMKVTLGIDHNYVLSPYMPFSSGVVHTLDVYNILMESSVDKAVKVKYMRIVLDIDDTNDTSVDVTNDSKTLH